MNQNESFSYTYSAQQQAEVQKIRSKYLPKEESKLDTLRRLDRSASQKAKAWSITVGIFGCLILGAGMSLIMTELSALLGDYSMFVGIPVGLIGLVLVALAYPVYNRVLQTQRQRIAPQILQLTEELLQ